MATEIKGTVHIKGQCRCYRCQYGDAAYRARIKESMQKFGWYVGAVEHDPDSPNEVNHHTHGLLRTWGHLDLQICFPMSGEVAHDIFSNCVDLIKKGQKFQIGNKYEDILGSGYAAMFILAEERNRPVLRLIIPNKEHGYTGLIYENQFILKVPNVLPPTNQ